MVLSLCQCEPIGGRLGGSAATKSWHWGKGKNAPPLRFCQNLEKVPSAKLQILQFKFVSSILMTFRIFHCLTQLGHTSSLTLGATLDSFLPSSFRSKPLRLPLQNTYQNEKLTNRPNLHQVAAFGRVWEDIQLVPKMVTKAQAGTLELPPEGEDQSRAQK